MLKYTQSDDQTLSVTGELRFLNQSDELSCVFYVIIASGLFTFAVYRLLIYLKVGGWLERFFFEPNGYGGIILFLIMLFVISRPLDAFYGPKFSIGRDGSIIARARGAEPILIIRIFKTGSYKFLIEKKHHNEIGMLDGVIDASNAYRMSIVEEHGGRFTIFVVSQWDKVKEFEKKFSDFTGLDFDLLRVP